MDSPDILWVNLPPLAVLCVTVVIFAYGRKHSKPGLMLGTCAIGWIFTCISLQFNLPMTAVVGTFGYPTIGDTASPEALLEYLTTSNAVAHRLSLVAHAFLQFSAVYAGLSATILCSWRSIAGVEKSTMT